MRHSDDIDIPGGPDARTAGTRGVLVEGLAAGAFAATGVAAAFYVLDLRLAEPLFTPTLLGRGLGGVLGLPWMTASAGAAVVVYTAFHYAAFVALATAVAAVVRRARRDASVLAAALLVVAVAELAFYGFVAVLGQVSATAAAAEPQLALGNALGLLLTGGWIWRAHPELRPEFAAAVAGTEPSPGR